MESVIKAVTVMTMALLLTNCGQDMEFAAPGDLGEKTNSESSVIGGDESSDSGSASSGTAGSTTGSDADADAGSDSVAESESSGSGLETGTALYEGDLVCEVEKVSSEIEKGSSGRKKFRAVTVVDLDNGIYVAQVLFYAFSAEGKVIGAVKSSRFKVGWYSALPTYGQNAFEGSSNDGALLIYSLNSECWELGRPECINAKVFGRANLKTATVQGDIEGIKSVFNMDHEGVSSDLNYAFCRGKLVAETVRETLAQVGYL
ncbi:MAG: hypothetical protein AB7P49_12860 [Bdellovibrionales bacterium]